MYIENVLVRKIKADEKEQVKKLFERVFADTFSAEPPNFEEATAGEQIYAALLDGSVVGMASVWEADCFIHFLFVDKAARHKGAGSSLVNKLAEEYGKPLTLKCLVGNKAAMAFYRSTGWQEIGAGISEQGEYSLLRYEKKQ